MTVSAPTIDHPDVSPSELNAPQVSVYAVGMSVGLFLAVSFVICVLFDLVFPGYAMNPIWAPLFPGFTWLSWTSFFIGLVESFAYGWYVAVILVPLYKFFAKQPQ